MPKKKNKGTRLDVGRVKRAPKAKGRTPVREAVDQVGGSRAALIDNPGFRSGATPWAEPGAETDGTMAMIRSLLVILLFMGLAGGALYVLAFRR